MPPSFAAHYGHHARTRLAGNLPMPDGHAMLEPKKIAEAKA
jgi:hypothetical protein